MQPFVIWLMSLLESNGIILPEAFKPYVALVFVAICTLLIVVFAAVYSGLFIYFERRIGARMMSRIGPNRVGPHGLLQWLADAVKLIVKEDIIPSAADRPLFKLAPYLMAIGVFSGFAVLPFSHKIIGADLNIGVLYVLAITSISVVGILMSGWASNSKWALFGGMRSAAQIVSYEIPTGMAILPAVLLSGSMSTQGIIQAQGGEPWNWFIFHSPMMFVLFFIFFIASLAEGSRTPFDLPEAESELVSGYNTEYSGFRFAAYFMSEFANTWILAAMAVIVFLGGWQIPFVPAEAITTWYWELASLGVFVFKVACLVFVIIQLRWTLPRVRVDQMMIVCWKYLVPITFIATILVLGWMLILPWESLPALVVRVVMTLMGFGVILAYIARVRYNMRQAKAKAYLHWAT